jgi:membrane associated rhomboid family serine protease
VIPLKDYNPTRRFSLVTVLILGACVVIYFFVQPTGQSAFLEADPQRQEVQQDREIRFTLYNAAIPCEVVTGEPLSQQEVAETFRPGGDPTACDRNDTTPPFYPGKKVYLAVLFSMFLHGGLLHLAGNMLFLWIFGNNIEDHWGHVRYAVFYLVAGLVATLAHVAAEPDSTVPMVGASGAIAGVMGAYLVMFPSVRIRTLLLFGFFFMFRDITAKWLLGFWFLLQFFTSPNSGVAWMAHVGGFVFGLLVGLGWRVLTPQRAVARPAPWRYD